MLVSSDSPFTNSTFELPVVKKWEQPLDAVQDAASITIDSIDLDPGQLKMQMEATFEKVNTFVQQDKRAARKEKALLKQERKEKALAKKQEAPVRQSIDTKIGYTDAADILAVRFSQDTIDPKSADGLDLFEVIRAKGWKKGTRIQVVEMPDAFNTSLDNRRLHAAKRVVDEVSRTFFYDRNALEASIYKHDVTSGGIAKDVKRLETKVGAKNSSLLLTNHQDLLLNSNSYGAMIYYRMRLGEGNFAGHPYGYNENPVVREAKD